MPSQKLAQESDDAILSDLDSDAFSPDAFFVDDFTVQLVERLNAIIYSDMESEREG